MGKQTIDFKRQVLLFNPKDFADKSVAVVGLGNVGSHTALALARLGIVNFYLWDPDIIEAHNIASQNFTEGELGISKARTIKFKVRTVNSGAAVLAYDSKFDPRKLAEADMLAPDIVVIAVDSMKERKRLAGLWKNQPWPALLIDARVGGNQLEVYNIRTLDEWQKTFSDNPDTDPCGGRYISYVSLMVAGVIANQVKKFLNEEPMDRNVVMDANSLQVIKNISW
jgi:tRNA A37 threonylcarbamoyladenosine dehydratase